MLKITSLELVFKEGKVKVSMEELIQLRKELDSLISATKDEDSFKNRIKKLEEKIDELPKQFPPIWPNPFPWIEPITPYPTYPGTTPHIPWEYPPIVWCSVGDDLTGPSTVSFSPKNISNNG